MTVEAGQSVKTPERRSQDGEATGTTWGDITKESEERKRGASRGLRGALKEMHGEENIISAVIHADGTNAHLHCDFVPLTKRGIYRRLRDRRQKENAQDAREF